MEIRAELSATVWKVQVDPGDRVEAGAELVILESMKMEIPVEAPMAGTVAEIRVKPEDRVTEGDVIAVLES